MAIAAGCGGDGDDDDEEAIREVVRLSLTTDDPEGDCNERLSERLVERTYGSRERCERIQGENEENSAESVEFAAVTVDGETASTEITARSAAVGQAQGTVELVQEGGDWRIDELSIPLLRTLVEVAFRETANLPKGGAACIERDLRALPDAEFRDFAYQLVGRQPESQRRIFDLLASCEGEGGVTLLRQLFEQGIVESLRRREASRQEIDCVLSATRARLDDDRLLELISGANANEAAARILAPALQACG